MLQSAVLLLLLSACTAADTVDRTGRVELRLVGEVQLSEPAESPLVAIAAVSRRPGGGFALADEASDRVHLYAEDGRLEEVLGGAGSGPGELNAPTSVIELSDGRIFVTQREGPRLTVYGSQDRSPQLLEVPGLYGFSIAPLGDRLLLGVGSREYRFAVTDLGGNLEARLASVFPEVNQTPFWIYFARARAAVVGDLVVTNTSFFPELRLYTGSGDSLPAIGQAPPSWAPATAPPIDAVRAAGDSDIITEWSKTFTVVSGLAAVADRYVAVQYGRHEPNRNDRYYVEPTSLDVYDVTGEKLIEDLAFRPRIVGGGAELITLSAEPPEPWTLSLYELAGGN